MFHNVHTWDSRLISLLSVGGRLWPTTADFVLLSVTALSTVQSGCWKKASIRRFKDGQQQTVNRSQCQFCYRNPSSMEESDDFLTLPNLDEPNILHSLRLVLFFIFVSPTILIPVQNFRVRYWKGHVYSYTGPILIAVNPWKPVIEWFELIILFVLNFGT